MRRNVLAALALSAALALGIAAPALAASPTAWDAADGIEPTITKKVEGNKTIITEDQTYTFSFEQRSYKTDDGGTDASADAAAIADVSVTLAAADVVDGTTTITTSASGTGSLIEAIKAAEFPHAGIYAYTVTESDGADATTASSDSYTMYVTVINGEDGTGDGSTLVVSKVQFASADDEGEGDKVTPEFTNTYEKDGSLEVTKTVSGANADKTKDFTFTVVVTLPENATAAGSYTGTYSGQHSHADATGTVSGKTVTFGDVTLADGEKFTVEDLPSGSTYTVTEAEADGYTTTKTGDTGTIPVDDTATAAFTNTKTDITPTGLILDNAPFIVLGAVAIAGIVIYGAAKRRLTA